MAEVYPSDSELLNLMSELETGVEYIPTGTAPYYLHFRKLLHRLLLATKRANDLRLYDEGGLVFGVKAGKFWDGNTLVEYVGSSGNVLADNKSGIFVYLDNAGGLHFTDYVMFPDQGTSNHVRLAKISTSGGDITSLVDYRDQHSIAMPDKNNVIVEDHTATDQLEHKESGSVHTNKGATGSITINMPSFSLAGTTFTICVVEAYEIKLHPTGNILLFDSGSVSINKDIYSGTIGDSVTIVMNEDGNWMVAALRGSWVQEA